MHTLRFYFMKHKHQRELKKTNVKLSDFLCLQNLQFMQLMMHITVAYKTINGFRVLSRTTRQVSKFHMKHI